MERLFAIVDWLSGEWMLMNRPNSGAIIFMRSLKVALLIFFSVLVIISSLDPDRGMTFSLPELQRLIIDKIHWLGAIFAATYTGFYTRYASQWSYLANLYNQIMSVKSIATEEQKGGRSFVNWQAGFIEDAMFLHLDRKPVFALPIRDLLHDPSILKAFITSSPPKLVDDALVRHIPDLLDQTKAFQKEIEAGAPPG